MPKVKSKAQNTKITNHIHYVKFRDELKNLQNLKNKKIVFRMIGNLKISNMMKFRTKFGVEWRCIRKTAMQYSYSLMIQVEKH